MEAVKQKVSVHLRSAQPLLWMHNPEAVFDSTSSSSLLTGACNFQTIPAIPHSP